MESRGVSAGAIATAREFVARQLSDGVYRGLEAGAPRDALTDAERGHGPALGGAAAEIARRLARRDGAAEPDFPAEPFPKLAAISDRGLAVFALRRAEEFNAGASPQVSRAALALEMASARLLMGDPEIWPEGPTTPAGQISSM